MIAAASLAAALALAGPASTGTGIQGSDVCLPVTAQPGHTYPLGTVYVADTGSGSEQISLTAQPIWKGDRLYRRTRAVPASWLNVSYPSVLWIFHRSYVQVAAGQGAYLPVTVTIPDGTASGRYAATLVASAGGSPSPGGISAGLASGATTDLELDVGMRPPACGLPVPSPAAVAASQRAEAAGDFSSAAADSKKSDAIGWVILGVIGLLIGAGLRKAMSR